VRPPALRPAFVALALLVPACRAAGPGTPPASGSSDSGPSDSGPGTTAPADLTATYTDADGTTGNYRLMVGAGVPASPGVLLFFDGDFLGKRFAADAAARVDIAAAHGLLVVSMQNPDLPPGNGCWWAPEVEEYARYVDGFVSEVLVGQWGVDPSRVFLTGLSGGSDFSAAFGYHTGWRYGGGAVALCGGDVPRLDGGSCDESLDPPAAPDPDKIPAAALADYRYAYRIDATDPLYDYATASAAWYSDHGFAHVDLQVVAGSGHCGFVDGFDGIKQLEDGLDSVDPRVTP